MKNFIDLESSSNSEEGCELDSIFSIIVQIFLAIGSFSILICKDYINYSKLNVLEKNHVDHGKFGFLMYLNKFVQQELNIF